MKEGPSDLGFCAHLERIQSVAPCTTICHFQKHLLKVSISSQRKGQGAVGRGNANQPPKENGGKACHLLFLFVFDIFLWSVGEERTKASSEGSLPHMLPVLSPVPAKSREGHVQLTFAGCPWHRLSGPSQSICSPVAPCWQPVPKDPRWQASIVHL